MDDFLRIHVKRGGYIFPRKRLFWSVKTVFSEKKCAGVFCSDEKLDICKKSGWLTEWKFSGSDVRCWTMRNSEKTMRGSIPEQPLRVGRNAGTGKRASMIRKRKQSGKYMSMVSSEVDTVDFPKLVTKSSLVGNRDLHRQKMILPERLTVK